MNRMHCPRTLPERLGIDIDGPYTPRVDRAYRAVFVGLAVVAACVVGAAWFARW